MHASPLFLSFVLAFLLTSEGGGQRIGDETVLVVALQGNPDIFGAFHTDQNITKLSERVFDSNLDVMDVTKIYRICSHGKLNFVKAPDKIGNNGAVIQNGTKAPIYILVLWMSYYPSNKHTTQESQR